jgi:hypothetical protein
MRVFAVTVQHFFGGFTRLFQGLTDGRLASHITYQLQTLMATGVLMFVCRLESRRQINALLRHNGPSAAKYQAYFGAAACPHGDTLNYGYIRSQVSEVQEVVTGMTATLMRGKVLYP